MGADGGIEWMKIKKPECLPRLLELLRPFGIQYGIYGSYDSYHYEWITKNAPELYDESQYFLSVYGTDISDDLLGLGRLHDMINGLSSPGYNSVQEEKIFGINVKNTFLEIIEERETRPNCYNGVCNPYDELLEALFGCDWEKLSENVKRETIEYNRSILEMTVEDWVLEVGKILAIGTYAKAETWT